MKNIPLWKPSKYEYRKGTLRGSRNETELSLSSRLLADNVAGFYQKYLKDFAKGRLADLGCGKVPLYCEYKKYVDEVICIDWAESFHINSHLDIECNLNEQLPLENEIFDTIILSDVMEHIAEPGLLFREMSRTLRKEGYLLMNVPFYYRIHEAPHDYFRYTEFSLRYFCNACGFNLVKLEVLGGVPEVLLDIVTKSIAYKPIIGKPLAKLFIFFYNLFRRTGLGKRFSESSGKTFPFGYFLIAEKTSQVFDADTPRPFRSQQ